MDRLMKYVFVLALVALLGGVATMMVLASRATAPAIDPAQSATPEKPVLKIPPFALIDQTGQARTESVLDGQVTIVDFMFTNCPLACPVMTGQMQKLQKRLAGTGVRFLSLSIDPGNDTPAVLTDYIENRFKIDTANWLFLTEPPERQPRFIARSIFANDLMQFVQEQPGDKIKTSVGGEMSNINHAVNLFLIGPDRRALGWYNSQRPDEMEQLFDHALNAAGQFLPKRN